MWPARDICNDKKDQIMIKDMWYTFKEKINWIHCCLIVNCNKMKLKFDSRIKYEHQTHARTYIYALSLILLQQTTTLLHVCTHAYWCILYLLKLYTITLE